MKNKIIFLIACFLLLQFSYSTSPVLEVEFEVDKFGKIISIENILTIISEPTPKTLTFNYLLELEYLSGKTEIVRFNLNNYIYTYDFVPLDGFTFIDSKKEVFYPKYRLSLPYKIEYSNLSKITLQQYNKNKEIESIAEFQVENILCNNDSICNKTETFISCPNDCSAKNDNVCTPQKDSMCDLDCIAGLDLDCFITSDLINISNEKNSDLDGFLIPLLGVIILGLLLIGFVIFKWKK